MKKGIFITFEGVDGCGKSTQLRFAAEYLTELGEDFIVTREPGGCAVSEKIREILLDVENTGMEDYTEALLYAASRVEHAEKIVMPALSEGKIVLCDRYIDSSIAYQGFGRGLGADTVMAINSHAAKYCMPDATIFLDFAPKGMKERTKNRGEEKDRLEQEDISFFEKVYEGFCWTAKQYPERVIPVDVSGTKEQSREKIRAALKKVLEDKRG